MTHEEFDSIVEQEWKQVPPRFAKHIENVVLLLEDEPSEDLRKEEKLTLHDTLLGHYRGVPQSVRGAAYGIGGTLPDTITLFRNPILAEAVRFDLRKGTTQNEPSGVSVREAIRETLWHEIGHYFGLSEAAIDAREAAGTNAFHAE